eukprot:TRINITY_DN971_c0_g1_i1.p1 TRINITY_DN971_c0_g1~~TRINITY_DN971_c0_g1_i1.p1  ORF type:complete len:149 (-),score=36.84 TRINITY_DN971_c0_g1_i1:185-631(-)
MTSSDSGWDDVTVLRKKSSKPTSASAVSSGLKSGELETVKRVDGGANKKRSAPSNAAKLDAETEDFKQPKISHEFKIALMQARQAKKMTQADLAKKLNVKATIVNDYEAGRAIPDPSLIAKMSRILGAKLPKILKPKKISASDDDDKS